MTNTMNAQQSAKAIRFFVMDVDGVLSDGSLYFGNSGEEIKAFNIRDGLGIKWLQDSGITTAIITGRISNIVQNRADNLGIHHVVQGREDKRTALMEACNELGFSLQETAYIGDDVQDLGAIQAAGLGCTVKNGDDLVKQYANWQSQRCGGDGAVRELAEFILNAQDKLNDIQSGYIAD